MVDVKPTGKLPPSVPRHPQPEPISPCVSWPSVIVTTYAANMSR